MTFIQRFKINTYLLVFLSFASLAFAERNLALFWLSAIVLLLSWLLVENHPTRTLPRWCINLGIFISTILLLCEPVVFHQDSLLLALGHFMIALILCKSFETKEGRDYFQILVLSLLLMIISSIFSSSVFFGLFFALYLALGLHAILLLHLRAETMAAHARGVPLPPPSLELPIREAIRRASWAAGTVMALLAAAVFLFLPRDRGRDMFGTWTLGSNDLVTGFSENVSLEPGTPITESNVVVMQVHMEQKGVAYGNAGMQPYFRGLTLDFYDTLAKQWLRIPAISTWDRKIESRDGYIHLSPVDAAERGTLIKQSYTVFNADEYLFSLPEAVLLRSNQIPRDRPYNGIQRNLYDNSITLMGRPPLEFQYEVQSYAAYRQQKPPELPWPAGMGRLRPTGRYEFTPIPDPIVAKAHEIADPVLPKNGARPTPDQVREIADRMVEALSHYSYTLNNPPIQDPQLDPISDFIKNKQDIGGHCEYFASAMTLMCSALEIPARIATGYHGGTYNTVGDFYVVRQKNAHAWVEVYLQDEGWKIFDPTPPTSDVDIDDRSILLVWTEQLIQTIEHQWLTTVIGFDDTTRRYIFENTLQGLQAIPQWIAVNVSDSITGFADLVSTRRSTITARVAYVVELIALLGCALWISVRLFRWRQSTVRKLLRQTGRSDQRELAVELGFFDELIRILRKTGVRRSNWQTPREYVNLACAGRDDAKAEAEWVVATFYEIWFGGTKINPQLRERIDGALNRLRQVIAK